MTDANPQNAAAAAAPAQEFSIQKLYVKDISFETPRSPQVFTRDWNPETSVQLNTEVKQIEEGVHEVNLTITVTTTSNGETAYLIEVTQAGIFLARGFPREQMGPLLGAYCPNVLFPFAREVVSDLIIRGGFPPMLLAPVNFDALLAQQMQQAAQQAGDTAAPAPIA
ncbi:MAG: protein-export chaperone SecB [Chromatiales bacterium]|jgi:preprotein translocase subunit SecB|nr:protein-export chaperone SecB [Chromatiales bacterium]MDX9768057.1 protein-export chaperone SecB [Ectothiorhodospiraceae bacterium]